MAGRDYFTERNWGLKYGTERIYTEHRTAIQVLRKAQLHCILLVK